MKKSLRCCRHCVPYGLYNWPTSMFTATEHNHRASHAQYALTFSSRGRPRSGPVRHQHGWLVCRVAKSTCYQPSMHARACSVTSDPQRHLRPFSTTGPPAARQSVCGGMVTARDSRQIPRLVFVRLFRPPGRHVVCNHRAAERSGSLVPPCQHSPKPRVLRGSRVRFTTYR